jgi:ubiquinone/menaquinone biosynthesis C-methylase UbiE
MSPAIVSIVIGVVIIVLGLGLTRVALPRRAGFEEIEDPEAAQAYDQISRWPQFRFLRRMIVAKLSRHKPRGTLADIGCGPGRLVILIAQRHRGLHVMGVDSAREMIRVATLNASALGLGEQVEFREGDVGSLPLADGALDFAVSTLSLHHWSDPGLGLAETHRVLKEGGEFLLFDLRRDARRFFYFLLRFAQGVVVPTGLRRANEPLGSLLSSYTLAEVRDLLARSPFREWSVEGGAGWFFAWARRRTQTA